MSREATIYLVGAGCAIFALAAFVGFILAPAWTAYDRIWQKLVAGVLSLYVLVAFVGVGVLAGGAVVWYWDRL